MKSSINHFRNHGTLDKTLSAGLGRDALSDNMRASTLEPGTRAALDRLMVARTRVSVERTDENVDKAAQLFKGKLGLKFGARKAAGGAGGNDGGLPVTAAVAAAAGQRLRPASAMAAPRSSSGRSSPSQAPPTRPQSAAGGTRVQSFGAPRLLANARPMSAASLRPAVSLLAARK
jgi:hypothetical protein